MSSRVRCRHAFLVLTLVLAGCSDQPAAVLPPPPPLPADVAAADRLEVPASATAVTPQGAAAFARHYLAVVSRAFNTGAVAHVRELSHPECGTCRNFVNITAADAERGIRIEGAPFVVETAEASEVEPGDAIVDLFYTRTAGRKRDATGAVVAEVRAEGRTFMQLRAVQQNGRWIARAIRFPKVPTG